MAWNNDLFKIHNKGKCSHKWVISLIPESCTYSPVRFLSRHFWEKEKKSQITLHIQAIWIVFGSSTSFFYSICRIRMSCCFCAYSWLVCTNLPLNALTEHAKVGGWINNNMVGTNCLTQNSTEWQPCTECSLLSLRTRPISQVTLQRMSQSLSHSPAEWSEASYLTWNRAQWFFHWQNSIIRLSGYNISVNN